MEKLEISARTDDTVTLTGPQNARIDSSSGLRWYTWKDRKLLSVTSARTEAGMPHGLHQWQLSQVIDRAVDNPDQIITMRNRPRKPRERVRDKNAREEACRWLRGAATEERDRKAALGTAVHDAAAQGVDPDFLLTTSMTIKDGERVTEVSGRLIVPRLKWFHSFLRETGAKILVQEFQVWNLSEGYAGTCDLLVLFPNGQVWVIDLKTGDGTYPEHALQLVAYRRAEFSGKDNVVDPYATDLFRQASGLAILHLNEDGWEFVSVRNDERTWQAFLSILRFATWSQEVGRTGDYVLARKAYPTLEQQQDAVVADMAAELERRTAA